MSQLTKEANAYLLQIQQGDRSQMTPLYDLTAGHLIAVARQYVFNKNLVEDVVLEAFIRIDKYIKSFNFSQDGYNWMCMIVQHVAFDFNKDEKAIADAEEKYLKMQELVAPVDNLDSISFWEKLQFLDETDRYIVYRRFVEKESLEVIGRALNVTRAAICKRLKVIFKKLEKFLKKGKQK